MAEAWARYLKGDRIEPYSAGVEPHAVDPRAIKAMAEVGIDISGQKSKSIDEFGDVAFDYVITLCDHAAQSCPVFPAKTKVIHVGFEDPPKFAADAGDEEEAMGHYRRIRDDIKRFVKQLPEALLDTHE
jgi:arsenate reductase